MNAVLEKLVDDDNRIIRLFTPPFAKSARIRATSSPIRPGVRENGGQYTHAATWVVLALAANEPRRRRLALLSNC